MILTKAFYDGKWLPKTIQQAVVSTAWELKVVITQGTQYAQCEPEPQIVNFQVPLSHSSNLELISTGSAAIVISF